MATGREKSRGIGTSIRDTHTHKRGKLQNLYEATTGRKSKMVDRGTFGSRSQLVVGMTDTAAIARKEHQRAEWAAKGLSARAADKVADKKAPVPKGSSGTGGWVGGPAGSRGSCHWSRISDRWS